MEREPKLGHRRDHTSVGLPDCASRDGATQGSSLLLVWLRSDRSLGHLSQLSRDLNRLGIDQYQLRGLQPDLMLCGADLRLDDLDAQIEAAFRPGRASWWLVTPIAGRE